MSNLSPPPAVDADTCDPRLSGRTRGSADPQVSDSIGQAGRTYKRGISGPNSVMAASDLDRWLTGQRRRSTATTLPRIMAFAAGIGW
jgi:hypothetical protein